MLYFRSIPRFQLFASSCKPCFSEKNMIGLKKKCGCKGDKQPNLNVSFSTMVQKFKVLSTPLKSESDKKEYKLLFVFYIKKIPITSYFRVIQLENGIIACLISDPSVALSDHEEEALSENESTDDEMTSGEETNESGTSDDEDEVASVEQKMVVFLTISKDYFTYT